MGLRPTNRKFVEFFVGLSERHQHPGVVWPQLVGLLVVVEAVEVHLEDLVGLTQAVPSSVVAAIDVLRDREIHHQTSKKNRSKSVDKLITLVAWTEGDLRTH